MKQPPKYKSAVVTWIVIYPTINLIMLVFGDSLNSLSLPLRTFVMTIILVPLMVYVLIPFANRVFGRWLSS